MSTENASFSIRPVRPSVPLDRKAATSMALEGNLSKSTAGTDSGGRGRKGEEDGGATFSVVRPVLG